MPTTPGGNAQPHASPTVTRGAEHYLQAIYALTAERRVVIGAHLAQHLRVSAPSVTQTLKRLERDGLVTLVSKGDRKEIHLTPAGMKVGEAATRKHRLIETWLVSHLKLRTTEAHEAAERLEAGFSELLLTRLFDAIGRPFACPHGNPIPGWGKIDHDGTYLDAANPGEVVEIGRITEEAEADLDLLEYLERNRVAPTTRLSIIAVDRLSGAVTARTNLGHEVRIEKRSAALIYVRPVARSDTSAGVPSREPAPPASADARQAGATPGERNRPDLLGGGPDARGLGVASRPLDGGNPVRATPS